MGRKRGSAAAKSTKAKKALEDLPPPEAEDLSDDDLPSTGLSHNSSMSSVSQGGSIAVGDVVWARHPRWPHWPCVVCNKVAKSVYVNYFAYMYNGPSLRCGKKNVLPYNCKEKEDLKKGFSSPLFKVKNAVKRQKENEEAFDNAKKQAEDYLMYKVNPDSDMFSPADKREFEHMADYSKTCKTSNLTQSHISGQLESKTFNSSDSESDNSSSETEESEPTDQPDECDTPDENHETESEIVSENSKYADKDIILKEIEQFRDELQKIFKGETGSWWHKTFFSAGRKDRNSLKQKAGFGPIPIHERGLVLGKLVEMIKSFQTSEEPNTLCHVTYAGDVMVPETVIRLIRNIEGVTLEEAKQRYNSYPSFG
eukprot:m.58881 g.58881  ORF g.58881 m.58881 type:complete len:368 (+) comp34840_c0_seq2:434-1537(+)